MLHSIRVLLSITAFQKLRHWVDMAKGEISGLGIVSEIRRNGGPVKSYIVDDIFLLKQQSGSTDTLLDDQAIGQFLTGMVQQGIDTSKIKLWWHSHGELKTFWSMTDEECINNLENSSFMISLVTNKAKEILTRIDIYQPFHVTAQNVETEIHYPERSGLEEFCKKEFKSKVIEHVYTPAPTIDRVDPMPFPGRGDRIDAEIDQLERLVGDGKMSVDEFDQRVNDLIIQEEAQME